MPINVSHANVQAGEISKHASTLQGIRNSLSSFKVSLNGAWRSQEMTYVNSAIDMMMNDLASLVSELGSLSGDISSVAQEIRNEEIAIENAAREALARAQAIEQAKQAAAAEAAMRAAYQPKGTSNYR